MHRVTYTTGGTPRQTVDLDCESLAIGLGGGLRSRGWGYELTARGARSVGLAAREVPLEAVARRAQADELRRAADRDLAAGTPGTITADGWSQRCYIPASETDNAFGGTVWLSMTVLLLDGYWWREVTRELFANASAGGLDHPHDHPHDYGHQSGRATVEVGGIGGCPVRITFRGPATNPYVVVAGNRYEVDESVPSGARLVLDATGERPTVMLVDRVGNAVDVFRKAVRDGGQGGGSYAFEPLPVGAHEVTWSGGFGMELAWRERETEPPWTL